MLGGLWSTLVNLGLFAWALSSGRSLAEAMTMTFVSLVLIQFFKAYNFRSDRHSVLVRPFANKWLNLAIVWELAALALIIYLARSARAVRHVPAAPRGLGHRGGRGVHGLAGARAGEVDGAAGLVREPQLVRGGRRPRGKGGVE